MKVRHGSPDDRPKVPCTDCDKKFADKDTLKDHFRVKHNGDKPYKCKECPNAFPRSDYLKSHLYSSHGVEKPFKCGFCDYRSEVAKNIENHERTHTKEKPFDCKKCSMKFGNKGNLAVHFKRIHDMNVQSR